MTPEAKVKLAVKKALATLGILPASRAGLFPEDAQGWYFMPVSGGMGVHGVPDVLGHFRGRFFAVETKAPGRKPTALQELQIKTLRETGALVFVVSTGADIDFMVQVLGR